MQIIEILDSFLTLPYVVWMEDVIYQKNSDSQTFDKYHSSSLLVLHYKMSGRAHPLTLKQRTKECSSVKTNEDLFFLNLMIDFSRIAQHILVQRPVHGTGVEFLAPYFDSYIPFCTFDTQLGSMLTISFFYFRNRLQQSNLHWLSFYSESSEHLFLGRSWNSIRPSTGMDGPYTQVQWSHNSLPRSKRKSLLSLQQFSNHLPGKTLRRSSASYFGRLHLFTMSASYWPPCTETLTPSQRQTTASTQQNGNHS